MLKRYGALLAWLAIAGGTVHAQPQDSSARPTSERAPAKVLYIGNSYTYYYRMPAMIYAMARTEGSPREIHNKIVAVPAATLQMHWESGVARQAIHERKWDYVVLQEQSLVPLEKQELMFQYARLFDKEIKLNGAKTVLFLTWARRAQPETQMALNSAYTNLAKELGALVAPVGPAWQIARQRAADLPLYDEDGSHPSRVGSYLIACVLYLVVQAPERQCPALENEGLSSDASESARAAAAAAVAQDR